MLFHLLHVTLLADARRSLFCEILSPFFPPQQREQSRATNPKMAETKDTTSPMGAFSPDVSIAVVCGVSLLLILDC